MLQTSRFLRVARARLRDPPGKRVAFDVDSAILRVSAIKEAVSHLRKAGQLTTDQSGSRKKSTLLPKVYAALAGKNMTINEASNQIRLAETYRNNPVGPGECKLNLRWNAPYSVPFEQDRFVCAPQVKDLQFALARWLDSDTYAQVQNLLRWQAGHTVSALEEANYFGGHIGGTVVTDTIKRVMKVEHPCGIHLPASMIVGTTSLMLVRFARAYSYMSQYGLPAIAAEWNTSEKEAADLMAKLIDLLEKMAIEGKDTMEKLREPQPLPKGHKLTGSKK